jgi:hypothetical protein
MSLRMGRSGTNVLILKIFSAKNGIYDSQHCKIGTYDAKVESEHWFLILKVPFFAANCK